MKTKAFLGIDVSKGYADFVLMDETKEILEKPFQLDDTKSDRDILSDLIHSWFNSGIKELYCGVESTGGYENNWFNYLQKMSLSKNVKVARLNPKGVKSLSEATLKRSITDSVSAVNIAVYLMSFPEKVMYSNQLTPTGYAFKEGRQCLTFKRMLVKQKVQLNNQLEKLLYQYFDEVLVYCRHGVPDWLLRLLIKYPSAKQIQRAQQKMLIKIKGISTNKAIALLKKTEHSDQNTSPNIKHIISQTAQEILHKKQLINAEEKRNTAQYKDNDQVKLLNSITGIGIPSAVNIMLEIEDIKRFELSKQICSYFGAHPSIKESGDGKWKSRLSKRGRPEIRATLYMCSLTAIRHDKNLKQLYARFRQQGMNHYEAICVVMHKMLRIIFGVLKNQTPYNPEIDKKNREMAAQRRNETEVKCNGLKKEKRRRAERFKGKEMQAPISRRMAQKRKKQEESQSSLLEDSTGLSPAEIKV